MNTCCSSFTRKLTWSYIMPTSQVGVTILKFFPKEYFRFSSWGIPFGLCILDISMLPNYVLVSTVTAMALFSQEGFIFFIYVENHKKNHLPTILELYLPWCPLQQTASFWMQVLTSITLLCKTGIHSYNGKNPQIPCAKFGIQFVTFRLKKIV